MWTEDDNERLEREDNCTVQLQSRLLREKCPIAEKVQRFIELLDLASVSKMMIGTLKERCFRRICWIKSQAEYTIIDVKQTTKFVVARDYSEHTNG